MSEPEDDLPTPPSPDLEPIVEKISTEHGFDVRGYKRTTLYRRIRKRMTDARCATAEDYLVRLETDPHEYSQLVNTILINVTEFFRDPASWEFFQKECLEPLVHGRESHEPLRAWSVGCATGEEAYSLAICLAELGAGSPHPAKIYATDMDEGALVVARSGVYGPDDLRNVAPERRARFFDELPGGRFRVRREIRSMVIFGHHNVLEHAPISRLDVLVCRNLLIYFDNDSQQQLLRRFHYALRDSGVLFLGKAETLMSRSTLFKSLEARHRVFQKATAQAAGGRLVAAAYRSSVHPSEAGSARSARDGSVPLELAPAPILVLDRDGTIRDASPAAREIFGIPDQLLGAPLVQIDERFRPPTLRLAIEDARTTGRETRVDELVLPRGDGGLVVLNVTVRPVGPSPSNVSRLVLWCDDITREQDLTGELQRVRQELETTSEELQTTNEELETTNEELQSTNEELETTNEELQSTNEELETTVEELQSTNEELETANDELRARQEELNDRDRFQSMILSSLQMGVVVVWSNWEVVSWNRTCEELWGVREEEVVRHNLFALDTGMPFEQLRRPLLAVTQGDQPVQVLEVDAVNRRGKPIRCRVRIYPLQEQVDGATGAMILVEEAGER